MNDHVSYDMHKLLLGPGIAHGSKPPGRLPIGLFGGYTYSRVFSGMPWLSKANYAPESSLPGSKSLVDPGDWFPMLLVDSRDFSMDGQRRISPR